MKYRGIRNYLNVSDQGVLKRYSIDKNLCVELGAFNGCGAAIMAEKSNHVITIDVFEDIDKIVDNDMREIYKEMFNTYNNTYESVKENLKRFENIEVIKSLTFEYARFVKNVDTLFIDSDHSYLGVSLDFYSWFPRINVSGHIIFHDWDKPEFGVSKFIKTVEDSSAIQLVETTKTSQVFEKVEELL